MTEAHGQRLAFLAEASRILAKSLNYEHTLTRLAQLAVPELADWCAIHIITDDDSVQRLSVAHVDENKVQWARELFERYPVNPDSPSGLAHVLRTGKSELFVDIPDAMLVEAADDAEHLELLRTVGLTSAMIVPLLARGRTLGAMTFVTAESRRHYGLADLEFVQDLARRTAVSVDNARLYLEAQRAILAREEFISIASHELKTPLTTVKSYAQMLAARLRKPAIDPDRLQYLTSRLEDQILRLETLVIDLLDASRIQQGRLEICLESVDLVPLTREVMSRFEDTPERLPEHSLVLDAPESVVGNWDPARLDQVLTNLVSNALKYSPQGGEIRIMLRQHAHDAEIAVSDQGIGITPEEQAHLFEPFTRTARSGEVASGQGLGLFITAQIVQAHQGTIDIESQPQHGSTFIIHLPR
jgi:signal transduction histidine kinase